MKNLLLILLICEVLFYAQITNAQTPISYTDFVEHFESSSLPAGWSNEITDGSKNWDFKDGSFDSWHEPFEAYEGNYNAVFAFLDANTSKTKLVTPPINFDLAGKPVLRFYHAQFYFEDWFGSGNTRLNIYYRSPELYNNSWQLLKTYTDSVNEWRLNQLLLPDTLKYTSYAQLGFEGWSTSKNEQGTCIDFVHIIETDTIAKNVKSIAATQASQDIVPTGSRNNPILRIKITVKGNDGNLLLDSIGINALFDSENTVSEEGVKLFTTENERFYDTIPIGLASSISEGKVIFDHIGYDLPFGDSYLWVTYDIGEDLNHEFKGKKLDASIDAYGIKINNAYLPSFEINPPGHRIVNESLFFDDFEDEVLWDLSGEFEIDMPIGLDMPQYPEPDPSYAQSGKNVLGTDITGLNTYLGYYEKNITTELKYTATADTVINAKYYKDLKISYYRWLNIFTIDSVAIELSRNNGLNWYPIWKNTGSINENKWSFKQINLSDIADRHSDLMFRISLGPTANTPQSGWNIDNFAITGTFVEDDAGFLSLITPTAGCGHVAPEPVEIVVQNYGYSTTNDTIPVGYSTDGGDTWVMDTVFEAIPREGTANFTFNEPIDLTSPGFHNIIVQTFYSLDEDSRNDKLDTTLYIPPTYTPPYAQSFENGSDFWRSFGSNETWELGVPSDTTITQAFSGNKCWATNLNGHYPDNDTAWIESPCFNFLNVEKPIFECMLWADAERDEDGLALYYSLNEGVSWELVPTESSYAFSWDWYNNSTITSLGTEGFDSVHNGWFKTRQLLPTEVAGQAVVKFKLLFISNDTITNAGFAIDNIKIYDAPIDAGVTAIVNPSDACTLSAEESVTLTIRNYGIRKITPSDSIAASINVNGLTVLSEIFHPTDTIIVGGTNNFTFSSTVDFEAKGDYNLVCYTHIIGDTSFYIPNTHNDTLIDVITVSGEPDYSLGPDIGTLNPVGVTLDAKGFYTTGTFNSYAWKNLYDLSTGSTQTFAVPAFPVGVTEMEFSIVVENNVSCFAYDTIKVIKSISDLGVTAAIGTVDACINIQGSQYLEITIQNNSVDTTYQTGNVLQAGYQFEGLEQYVEDFTLTASMANTESETFTFTTPPVFPDSGSYNLKVFSVIYADLNYNNDTTYVPVTIWPYPEVNIGDDTVYTLEAIADIGTFDATNANFSSYKWMNNPVLNTPTYTITTNESEEYTIEVTDIHACGIGYDTVRVVADNWVVDTLISPISSCALGNENISFVLINNSPNTYPIGYEIICEINVNGIIKKDTLSLASALNPSESIDYISSKTFNFSEPDNYSVKIELLPEKDMNFADNRLEKTIEVWGIFPVDIGVDSVFTQNADTIKLSPNNEYYSYLWQSIDDWGTETSLGTEKDFYITNKNSDKYMLNVISEHGCSNSKDSVKVIAYDIGITQIISPSSICKLDDVDRIKVTLQNFGPDKLPAGENINLFYKINEGTWVELTHTTTVDLEPEASMNIILFENIILESTENYDMQMHVQWDKDYYAENDTAKTSIYQYPPENVDLGPDIVSAQPDTIILDAGAGSTTYTWQDGSELQTFNVSNKYSDSYSVLVTNAFGCNDRDTINIISNDLTVNFSAGNENSCTIGARDVAIAIGVSGQDSIFPGYVLDASYQLNALTAITETVSVSDTITADDSFIYTFSTQLSITDTGNYSLKTSIIPDLDTDTTNNSVTSAMRIGAYPVSLGDDIITYAPTYLLDAGAGFDAYLWGDATTDQTRTVSISDTYSVTVTDINGCTAADEVKVLFLNPTYDITEIIGLANACENFDSKEISFSLLNSGNDTVFADSVISIAYSINDLTPISENYQFANSFIPGESVTIAFNTEADLSNIDTFAVEVTATFGSKTSELDTTINTWGLPTINLGDDIKSVEETVDIDAGAGFESYEWSTDEQTQIITVSEDGIYSVTVSSEHGCENSDAIKVSFVSAALHVSEFIGPNEGCSPLSNEKASIKILNYGKRVIAAGTNIGLGYSLAGQARIDESIEISTMQPQATYTHEFEQFLFTAETGSVDIQFYIKVEGVDVDTSDYTIMVNDLPVFAFESDTIQVNEYPYTLDPEIEADSYKWNTGATTPAIVVNNDGSYILQISNTNNCSFSDTVYIENVNSVNNKWANGINIFPNPAKEKLHIQIPNISDQTIIEFVDNSGKRLIYSKQIQTDNEFDISNWSKGVYFVRIFDDENYAMFKVVIQ